MSLKLWTVHFTYDEHEPESDIFVHTNSPRPTTADAHAMLLKQHTDADETGYMQDALEQPELLVVDGVYPFDTVGDIDGNPYKIIVQE